MKKILILTSTLFLFDSCIVLMYDVALIKNTSIVIENRTDSIVGFTFPGYVFTFTPYGTFSDHCFDTTMTSMHSPDKGYFLKTYKILPHSCFKIKTPINTWREWIPQDSNSISLFITQADDFYGTSVSTLHLDSLATRDDYIQRYDMTVEDFKSLMDEQGIPIITFPPDERMKAIRMWPKYGEYNVRP